MRWRSSVLSRGGLWQPNWQPRIGRSKPRLPVRCRRQRKAGLTSQVRKMVFRSAGRGNFRIFLTRRGLEAPHFFPRSDGFGGIPWAGVSCGLQRLCRLGAVLLQQLPLADVEACLAFLFGRCRRGKQRLFDQYSAQERAGRRAERAAHRDLCLSGVGAHKQQPSDVCRCENHEQHEQRTDSDNSDPSHGKSASSRDFAHAARRASTIASTN